MRVPEDPPSLAPHVLRHMGTPDAQRYVRSINGSYEHWDKARHRTPPEGLTAEHAWSLVRMSRMSERRILPLQDLEGRAFSFWLPPPVMETLHVLDRWAGGTLALDEGTPRLFEEIREQVLVSSLMEEAIATSQIEGAATTREAAKAMLRAKRRPRDRSEQMIANSYHTIELLRQRTDRALSMDLLFEIQESMTRDTLDDGSAAGRLRTSADDIAVVNVGDGRVLFTPPPAANLRERMATMIRFANGDATGDEFIHPLVKASILHFWLAYEHPFVDGNGRTARALFYWFLLKRGYWLFQFLTVSRVIARLRPAYYRSFLHSEHDDGDMTYSIVFQLDATRRAVTELREYLRLKQKEQRELGVLLRRARELNERQRRILAHTLRHPDEPITFQAHQAEHRVTYVTARTDVLDLVARGLLVKARVGRQHAFFASEDLEKRLRTPTR